MSDPDQPAESTPLSPEHEEAVRRALADAAVPVPMPDDVAERIDATLADLVAERAEPSPTDAPAVVVPLDAAALRRRRRVRLLFGAAAAVAVVAVGVGVVSDPAADDAVTAHDLAQSDPARDGAAAGAAEAEAPDAAGSGVADDGARREQYNAEAPKALPEDAPMVQQKAKRVPTDQPVREIRADRLREDLVALQHAVLPSGEDADYSGATLTAPADFMCDPAPFGAGFLVGVQYAGKPAVVAFRAPLGTTQTAEVLACGTGDVLHSTTLPATG